MFGSATIEAPQTNGIGRSDIIDGLSDELAMVMGRTIALTLSEQDGYVIVTLGSGKRMLIGNDTLKDELVIGHLEVSLNRL